MTAPTRIGYDGITPEELPHDGDIYLSYVDRYSNGYYRLAQLFPGKIHLSIAGDPAHDADVLDCERTDATPQQCPGWVLRQRARGRVPWVYMNESTWPTVRQAFHLTSVDEPLWWVANTSQGPTILPATIGKQYQFTPGYDRSVFVASIPGVDTPAPAPSVPQPFPYLEDDMGKPWIIDGFGTSWIVDKEFKGRVAIPDQQDLAVLQAAHDADGTPSYGSGLVISETMLGTIPRILATPITP